MMLFLLFTVMQEMAHAQSKCEGEPLGGNLKFILPAITTTQMMESHCELQLAVEGYNRAIYVKGAVPNTVQLPVLDATMYDFTLNTCPGSVVLYLECPQIPDTTTIHCTCVNSTASTTSSTSIWIKSETPQDDTMDPIRHHAAAYTVTAAICICIVIIGLVIYYRKNNPSSVTSSTDSLSDELKNAC